jgi:2-oxoglutarate dehydrogenase E2 component (dihydrolipoamide succinyltransferase)
VSFTETIEHDAIKSMSVELKVPAVGESITEVQIGQWLKGEGQVVAKDDNLVEIETDKATVEIVAPEAGTISKVLKRSGETATVGEVIGYLVPGAVDVPAADEDSEQAAAAAQAQAAQAIRTAPKPAAKAPAPPRVESEQPATSATSAPPQRPAESSPPTTTPREISAPSARTAVARPSEVRKAPLPTQFAPGPREEEAVPMSPIRRRIAQRLLEAQHSAALLTTFNEVDMSAVSTLRNEHKQVFADRYGIKLGFMSFFVKAAIDALKLVPAVNAEIRGNDIVYHNYYDIGIAVGGGKGLVVPVLRDADRMSFAEIELAIADLATRARENSLQLEELQGGTFTISNGGVYGSMLSTPIVNPPQSGILGLHAIQDRPVARQGQVVIRPMMYLALTYDHRIVDGQGAVTFLKRVKDVIEEPMRMLVEI